LAVLENILFNGILVILLICITVSVWVIVNI